MPIIKEIIVREIRFPTSLEEHGSDAMVRVQVQLILRNSCKVYNYSLYIHPKTVFWINCVSLVRLLNLQLTWSQHARIFPGCRISILLIVANPRGKTRFRGNRSQYKMLFFPLHFYFLCLSIKILSAFNIFKSSVFNP